MPKPSILCVVSFPACGSGIGLMERSSMLQDRRRAALYRDLSRPMTFKLSIALIGLGVALTGCNYSYNSHNWAPGPQATGDLGIVSGKCKLLALESPHTSVSYETTDLSGIISGPIRQQNIYNACMEANGFVATDGTQPAAGYSPSAAPIENRPASPNPYPGNSKGKVAEINVYGATVYGHSGRLICECPKPTLKADGTWLGCADLSSDLNSTITGLNAKALPQMPLERYQTQLQQLITAVGFGPCWGA